MRQIHAGRARLINERARRSVGLLQTLFSIVMGLALAEVLQRVLSANSTDFYFHGTFPVSYSIPVKYFALLALVATLIPFFHGANLYLDDVYYFRDPDEDRTRDWAMLADFSFFFVIAMIFFAMASSVLDYDEFARLYFALFLLDSVRIVGTIFWASVDLRHVYKWVVLNAVTLCLLYALLYKVEQSPPLRIVTLSVFAVLRTIVDYAMNRDFYSGREISSPFL